MNKIELVNKINNYVFSGEDTELLDELNDLFDTGEYKVHLNLVFNIISITQMYGFLAYLNDEEKTYFTKLDKLRSQSYSGKKMDYYNSGQLSLLFELDTYKKVFFSAPTSFGKTSLIIEYIISNFQQFKNVLFIVPTNSLLEELYVKVININVQYDMGYHVSTQPYIQEARNNFLIITPERFLMLNEEIEVHQFDLIVMDETYKIVDSRNEKISDFIDKEDINPHYVYFTMYYIIKNKIPLKSIFGLAIVMKRQKVIDAYNELIDKYKDVKIQPENIDYVYKKEFKGGWRDLIG